MAEVVEQEPRRVANALDAASDQLSVECARNDENGRRRCSSDQATLPANRGWAYTQKAGHG